MLPNPLERFSLPRLMIPQHPIPNDLPIRHGPRQLCIMGYLLKIMLLHSIIPDFQRVLEYMPHTDERTPDDTYFDKAPVSSLFLSFHHGHPTYQSLQYYFTDIS